LSDRYGDAAVSMALDIARAARVACLGVVEEFYMEVAVRLVPFRSALHT
jgi:hypothetical protein